MVGYDLQSLQLRALTSCSRLSTLSWPSRVAAPHVIFIRVETQMATSCVAANATLQHQTCNRPHVEAASLGRVIYHVVNVIYHSRYCTTAAEVARPRSRSVLKCDFYCLRPSAR
jgi:hypothetical protein